jgi:hypothetical protein
MLPRNSLDICRAVLMPRPFLFSRGLFPRTILSSRGFFCNFSIALCPYPAVFSA